MIKGLRLTGVQHFKEGPKSNHCLLQYLEIDLGRWNRIAALLLAPVQQVPEPGCVGIDRLKLVDVSLDVGHFWSIWGPMFDEVWPCYYPQIAKTVVSGEVSPDLTSKFTTQYDDVLKGQLDVVSPEEDQREDDVVRAQSTALGRMGLLLGCYSVLERVVSRSPDTDKFDRAGNHHLPTLGDIWNRFQLGGGQGRARYPGSPGRQPSTLEDGSG